MRSTREFLGVEETVLFPDSSDDYKTTHLLKLTEHIFTNLYCM